MKLYTMLFSAVLYCAVIAIAYAGEIHFELEAPIATDVQSGVANIRGWGFSSVDIDRVELYVDGDFITNIPIGAARPDVGQAFPSNASAALSGFSMVFNYGLLSQGGHTFRVDIVDADGAVRSASRDIDVASFNQGFITEADPLDFSQAVVSGSGHQLNVQNVILNQQTYNLVLVWREESQQFEITEISQ
ncbi:MAG: hypothetical protein ACWA5R_08600 [bacterium]